MIFFYLLYRIEIISLRILKNFDRFRKFITDVRQIHTNENYSQNKLDFDLNILLRGTSFCQ